MCINSWRKGEFSHQPGQQHQEREYLYCTWGKVHKDCHRTNCNTHPIAKDTKQEESKPSTCSDRDIPGADPEGFDHLRPNPLFCKAQLQ